MNNLQQFAYDLVSFYSEFDQSDDQFYLRIDDIPDFMQSKFAALIMQEDIDRAGDATCQNNDLYAEKMLPALIKYMNDIGNQEKMNELADVWSDGISQYLNSYMQELLDEALIDYNDDKGCSKSMEQITGIRAHGEI